MAPLIFMRFSTTIVVLALSVFSTASSAFDFFVSPPGRVFEESVGRASVNVTNNSDEQLLLRIKVLPSGEENLAYRDGNFEAPFIVSRPVRIIEGNQTTRIDIIDVPGAHSNLDEESIFLLSVEGLRPPKDGETGRNRVGFSVEQVIPVFYRPASVVPVEALTEALVLDEDDSGLFIRNVTKQVVRVAEEVEVLPGNGEALFEKTYILPGETLRILSRDGSSKGVTGVKFRSVTYTGTLGAEAELTL